MWAQSQTWHGRAKVINTTANLEWAGPTNAMVQDVKLWDLECLLSYRHSSTITFWQALIRSFVFFNERVHPDHLGRCSMWVCPKNPQFQWLFIIPSHENDDFLQQKHPFIVSSVRKQLALHLWPWNNQWFLEFPSGLVMAIGTSHTPSTDPVPIPPTGAMSLRHDALPERAARSWSQCWTIDIDIS